jgi:hypothetical protein
MTTSDPWWIKTSGSRLRQGDLLPDCLLPLFVQMPEQVGSEGGMQEGELKRAQLIITTQSCDLENQKAVFVALCPAQSLMEYEADNPKFMKKGTWEAVRKGRVEGLHLLGGTNDPSDNRTALVVDFGHIVSLPLEYLTSHAESLGDRWRLQSPFLEHFSQSFARFFMRVGLPSDIPAFK